MGRSQRVRLTDLRDVYRLIGEVCELGAVPDEWRRHLLRRWTERVGARIGMVLQSHPPMVDGLQSLSSLVEVGFAAGELGVIFHYLYEGGIQRDPCVGPQVSLLMRGRHFTRTRRQMVPDDDLWYRSNQMEAYYEPMGLDDYMTSQFIFGPAAGFGTHTLSLHRDAGDRRPFSDRERRMTHILHVELGRLWDAKTRPRPDPLAGLPPRMRQTVALLRQGFTEREVADQFGISPHTAHDHVKRLHAHFGVASRAQLLVATAPPPVPYRPSLSP